MIVNFDCNKTLDYVNVFTRMCETYTEDGYYCSEECPLEKKGGCTLAFKITKERIALVQKWSDEHPLEVETITDALLKVFPKIPLDKNNVPESICAADMNIFDECPYADEISNTPCEEVGKWCTKCWNTPYNKEGIYD